MNAHFPSSVHYPQDFAEQSWDGVSPSFGRALLVWSVRIIGWLTILLGLAAGAAGYLLFESERARDLYTVVAFGLAVLLIPAGAMMASVSLSRPSAFTAKLERRRSTEPPWAS